MAALAPKAPPGGLRLAAAAQVVEAAGLCVAAAFGAVSTADGKSSQASNGVGLTVLAVAAAVGIALIAVALAIVLNFYNNHLTVDVDTAEELKG